MSNQHVLLKRIVSLERRVKALEEEWQDSANVKPSTGRILPVEETMKALTSKLEERESYEREQTERIVPEEEI